MKRTAVKVLKEGKQSVRKGRQCKLSGYMTVEAAYIFVTAMSIIIFAVSIGLYKYERCFFELESLYELQKVIQTGVNTKEYISIEGRNVILNRQKETKLFLGILGEKESTVQIEAKIYLPDPVLALRWRQRLKGMQEE